MEINSIEQYQSKIKETLITEDEIKAALKKAGKYIDSLYDGKPILLVSVLKGAFVFMADLCREVTVPCEVDFMCVKSYFEGMSSSGLVHIIVDLEKDISKYHVVIVEDIIDSGRTLSYLIDVLERRNPASLRLCTLLDKPDRRVVEDVHADYCCFEIPDEFVVGCGLDYKQKYRNLPFVGVVRFD